MSKDTELLVFEGIDGSGKSTQAQLFKENISSLGYDAELFREPGGTETAEKIRGILLDPDLYIEDAAEFCLFWASRFDLMNKVTSSDLDIAIYDRGPLSTWAYQVNARFNGDEGMKTVYKSFASRLPPRQTYVFDVSLETSSARSEGDDRIEAENEAFYRDVINGYHNPPDTENITWFNGENTIGELEEAVIQHFLDQETMRVNREHPLQRRPIRDEPVTTLNAYTAS